MESLDLEDEEDDDTEGKDDKLFSMSGTDSNTTDFGGEDFSFKELYKGKSLRDIRNEWEDKKMKVEGKREQKGRLIEVDGGVGVGRVKILKENFYSLEDGEPSVFGKGGELAGKVSIRLIHYIT